MIGGAIGGLIMALITIFKKQWSPLTAPIYALLEGLFLGGISAFFERSYPGIAVRAVALTFATLFVLLLAYKFGIVRAHAGFKLGVIAATGAICRGLPDQHNRDESFLPYPNVVSLQQFAAQHRD